MVKVRETEELENMLDQISQSYDRQVEMEVSAFITPLDPVMTLLMLGIIVFILLSALLPMFSDFISL